MLEHVHHFFETLAAIATVIALFLPWIWRWTSRINVTYTFSSNLANNHLPHIYKVQKLIAKKLDVEMPDDPSIQFVEINGKK